MSAQLIRSIQSKLPAAALDKVCENAPEGDHPDGGTYRDHCHRCIDLTLNADSMGGKNRETQALCVAGVIGSYIQNEASPEEVAALEAASDDGNLIVVNSDSTESAGAETVRPGSAGAETVRPESVALQAFDCASTGGSDPSC